MQRSQYMYKIDCDGSIYPVVYPARAVCHAQNKLVSSANTETVCISQAFEVKWTWIIVYTTYTVVLYNYIQAK